MSYKTIQRLHPAMRDDIGDLITQRPVPGPHIDQVDPFLFLNHHGPQVYPKHNRGLPFGPHPHRGFETVTFILDGLLAHRDSAGHESVIGPGGVQWMTAGRGLVHSELPEQEEGRMEGFQLWLNLPATDKMGEPWYRDIQSPEIPEFATPEGVTARVIAGASHGVAGAVQRAVTEPVYLDLHLDQGSSFSQALPATHNAFVYVYRGAVRIGGTEVGQQRMAILDNTEGSDGVTLQADQPARVLLIAGRPLKEPIAQYGPFVMNTNEQIFQAVEDFRAGKFS
jgi:redox-sensitive bicupin YhaK (pirin superfamily)